MSGIKHILPIFLLFVSLISCRKESNSPEKMDCPLEADTINTSVNSQKYQSLIQQYTSAGLPGISLLIKDSTGYYIASSGTADIESNIQLQPCHITHFSGVTQMMTAVAIFRLQEKGILSIEDPVNKYISNEKLKKIGNGDSPLKIKNLLNHTAGLHDILTDQDFYLGLINDPTKAQNSDDLLKYINNKPSMFAFRPVDTVGFSNTNYLLLSMIIESATGAPHSRVIIEEIITPLGLSETFYSPFQQSPSNKTSIGYYDLYGNNTLHNLSNWNTGLGNGYNGIYSTVWDMHLFLNALLVDKTLLEPESLNQMLTFEPDIESGKQMGMGCFRDFVDASNPGLTYSWGYRGKDLAYTAEVHYFPEYKTTMVLTVNYGTVKNSSLRYTYEAFRRKLASIVVNQ